ncbi:MAG: hypothetical protein RLZZ387_5355 [Chloroflexota bacterium]|jgi:hypothetical protein
MTIKQVYGWLYHGRRPNWRARGLNQFWAVVHALGVAPNYLVTLQLLGRRSGKLITFPLVMVVVDGERYLVSMLGLDVAWVRNLPATRYRALLRHGRTEIVQLEEIAVTQRGRILQSYARRAPGARAHLPVAVDAPLAAFEAVAAQLPVFRVRSVQQGA